MPKKFFKRISPTPQAIRESKIAALFGDLLHDPNLWHLNRRSAAGGTALGLFLAFIPLPIQMISAVTFSILLRVNLPITMAGVWVTNPLTIPPMFFFAYQVGAFIMGVPSNDIGFEQMDWDWVRNEMLLIWKPLLLGSLICSVVASISGYSIVRVLWRLHLVQRLKERRARKRRQAK